jgi:hypothetical protein
VSRDFDDVVGRVRVWLGKVGDNNVINTLALALALTVNVWSGRPRLLERRPSIRPESSLHGKSAGTHSTRFNKLSDNYATRFKVMFKAQHGRCNGSRLRPGNANKTDAAAAWWSCYGDDSVVKIHKEIVAGAGRAIDDPSVARHGSQCHRPCPHVMCSALQKQKEI